MECAHFSNPSKNSYCSVCSLPGLPWKFLHHIFVVHTITKRRVQPKNLGMFSHYLVPGPLYVTCWVDFDFANQIVFAIVFKIGLTSSVEEKILSLDVLGIPNFNPENFVQWNLGMLAFPWKWVSVISELHCRYHWYDMRGWTQLRKRRSIKSGLNESEMLNPLCISNYLALIAILLD